MLGVLMKPFEAAACFLYLGIRRRFPGIFRSGQVEADLARLYPGEEREGLREGYYVRKLAVCLAVAAAGAVMGVLAHLGAQREVILGEGGWVSRESPGTAGTERQPGEITVAVHCGGQEIMIRLPVEARRPDAGEADALFGELAERLPGLISGDNESLDAVSGDLNLKKSYEGYPFAVEWESGDLGVVGSGGEVYPGEEPRKVTLRARLTCGDYRGETEFSVTVRQPEKDRGEQLYRELERLVLATEESSREQEGFRLPEQFRGEELQWSQVVEDDSMLLWLATPLAAAAVYLLLDRDLHERLEKQRKALRREYPELVHRLLLFVGAGMTVRGAFQRMAGDYAAKREKGGAFSPAFEELRYTCRELRSGVSEGTAYENLGRRTGLQEYVRLCTLLTQNLKRGNSMLLDRLREEADRAADECLRQSRKLGEEAGTKLLVPMVMMLAVVMVMIMIPAFSGML